MSAKHTPGPWTPSGSIRCDTPDRDGRDDMMDFSTGIDCVAPFTENEFGGYERVEEQSVARAYGRSPQETHANARLIAAAPDLLDALQKLADEYGPQTGRMRIDSPRRPLWFSARAAIAKATGSAS